MVQTTAGAVMAPGIAAKEKCRTKRLFRQALTVRALVLGACVGVLGIVSYLIMPTKIFPADTSPTGSLVLILAGIAVMSAAGAIFLVPVAIPLRRFDGEPYREHAGVPEAHAIAGRLHIQAVHAGSWASIPALLGFALVLMGVEPGIYLGFLGVTLVGSAASFPRWREWERACGGPSSKC